MKFTFWWRIDEREWKWYRSTITHESAKEIINCAERWKEQCKIHGLAVRTVLRDASENVK